MVKKFEIGHREYKVLRLILTLLLFSTSAFADTVIFIGGYGATSDNMACWKKGAERQAAYAGYKFKTIKYPSGVAGYKNSITEKNAASQIAEIVNYINSRPNERFVIAAHSTGSDIAFLAAGQLKNPKNVDYVNLAGWNVPKHMYGLRKVTSISNPSSYGNCPQKPYWCRHFSLVNKTPPKDLELGTLSNGYSGCNTNLSWLPAKGREVVPASGDQKPDAPAIAPPAKPATITPSTLKTLSQPVAPKPSAPAVTNGTSGSFDDEPAPAKK